MSKAGKISGNRIGTEREGSLHRDLKIRYAGPGGAVEVSRGGYVCDAVSAEGEAVEVQTGSFGPLKEKVKALLRLGPVRIIHPVIIRKYIELYDTEGNLVRPRRRSPRKGSPWDLFKALLYAPALPVLKGLSIELVLVEVLERRIRDGHGSWRRGGDSITDRILIQYHETLALGSVRDFRRLLPFKPGEQFTVKKLAEAEGITTALAGKALYVLANIKAVERTEKKGNAWIYQIPQIYQIPLVTTKKAHHTKK
jgi:hypothetical protein